jgi:hypothetical protein
MFGSKDRKPASPASCQSADRLPLLESLEERVLMSTYYIATNGADTAAGGASASFATLRQAPMPPPTRTRPGHLTR